MNTTKIIVAILTILCMAACRTSRTTIVKEESANSHDTLYMTTVKVDTMYLNSIQWDSILIHDSIYEKEIQKGDTLMLTKYVEKLVYKDRLKTDTVYRTTLQKDTIYQSKTDTIKVSDIQTKTTTKGSWKTSLIFFMAGMLIGVVPMIASILHKDS